MDEEAFLAAIRAHPTDQRTRLVYADWLDENGQPEKAEFLRLQGELAAVLDRLQHVRSSVDVAWVRRVTIRRDVVVHDYQAEQRFRCVKTIRLRCSRGLKDVVELLAKLPARVMCNLTLERAEELRAELAEFATVTIESPVSE